MYSKNQIHMGKNVKELVSVGTSFELSDIDLGTQINLEEKYRIKTSRNSLKLRK
jgi:hypothetical protein